MASPVARVDRRKRPATSERPARISAASLAETLPFRREDRGPEAFGPYLVYEKLGEGGMASVHRAEHVCESGLRKPVALKRLHADCAEDPQLVAGFVREAQLAARLEHPNIARGYDLGRIDGTYYIAMELVAGPTLAKIAAMTRDGGAAVPLPIALEILIQIADALDHAHELTDDGGHPLGLVHRDVSPVNIVISPTGAAKLIDFGIAKVRAARPATEAGVIKGNLAYLAPEYTYGQLDRRSDVFSLGVVAHELLSGRRLFVADTELGAIRNVRELPVPPPSRSRPDISPELDEIVLTALARDPQRRWQTAGALRNALVIEARRLGVAVGAPQIRAWVEGASRQAPRRATSVDRLLDSLEPSLVVSVPLELDLGLGLDLGLDLGEPPPLPAPPSVELAAVPAPEAPPARRRRRPPPWRPPTRWIQPPPPRSLAPVVLVAVVALLALALDQRWIDLARWRELIESWI